MRENIIPANEAALVLDRWVKQAIPVFVWFVSGNGEMKSKVLGFVSSMTREGGVVITTRSPNLPPPDEPLPVFMTFSHASVVSSTFRYSDETELPSDFVLGSGLRIDFPSGETLTIAEIRENI